MDRTREEPSSTSIDLIHPRGLQIRLNTPKGRGVFATKTIPAGITVDISPVLILPAHESEGTTLAHYTYTWPAEGDNLVSQSKDASLLASPTETRAVKVPQQALALGLGSMFNHKRVPNVAWKRDIHTQSIQYFTIRDIAEGEELCISYGSKLWFEDADGPSLEDVADMYEADMLTCEANIFD